jgi:hypothetical protein
MAKPNPLFTNEQNAGRAVKEHPRMGASDQSDRGLHKKCPMQISRAVRHSALLCKSEP